MSNMRRRVLQCSPNQWIKIIGNEELTDTKLKCRFLQLAHTIGTEDEEYVIVGPISEILGKQEDGISIIMPHYIAESDLLKPNEVAILWTTNINEPWNVLEPSALKRIGLDEVAFTLPFVCTCTVVVRRSSSARVKLWAQTYFRHSAVSESCMLSVYVGSNIAMDTLQSMGGYKLKGESACTFLGTVGVACDYDVSFRITHEALPGYMKIDAEACTAVFDTHNQWTVCKFKLDKMSAWRGSYWIQNRLSFQLEQACVLYPPIGVAFIACPCKRCLNLNCFFPGFCKMSLDLANPCDDDTREAVFKIQAARK